MDNTLELIKILINEKGLLVAASILEHSDVQRLKRWIAQGKVPQSQIAGVRAIMTQKGVFKHDTKKSQL